MADDTTATEPAALYEQRGGVAIITLNRPKALNAVNSALSTAVGTLLEQAENDDDVRVIVITGSGRAFCAGADLKALAAGEATSADGHPEWGFAGYVQHWINKPTIAAVNGFALGGGTELVLASDLAVVDEEAQARTARGQARTVRRRGRRNPHAAADPPQGRARTRSHR